MKQLKTAFILIGVLAVLGGVAYWEELKTKDDQKLEKEKNKISSLTPEQVEALVYSSNADNKSVTVRLEKVDKKWMIVEPVKAEAEQQTVTSLIQTLTDYKYELKTNAGKSRWQEYGLQNPARSVTLVPKGGKEETVYIGNKAPVGYSVYLRLSSGDDVYVGGQQLYIATEKKLNDFRDKTFLSFKENDLIFAEIKNKKSDLSMERRAANDPYVALTPKGFDLDSDGVADFISSLSSEKAEEIIDAPSKELLAAFAPQKRLASLTWKAKGDLSGEAFFAEYDKKVFGSIQGVSQVFKLPDAIKAKLDKDMLGFRNKTVLKFESAAVSSVEVDGDSFLKEKGEWKKKGDDKAAAKDLPNIQTFVVDLEFAKTDSFPKATDLTSVTKSAPKHRIKLSFTAEAKRKDITLDVWPDAKQPTMVFVKHSDSPQIYHVNQSVFDSLSKKKGEPLERAAGAADGEAEEELFAPEEQMAN